MKDIILVTGGAGFIGAYLCEKLLSEFKCKVIAVDNLNDYYDVNIKFNRLENLKKYSNFLFEKGDISNKEFIEGIFCKYEPTIVVNLAAQAGVRYSITNPSAYIDSNIIGFFNILEACRYNSVKHLIFASSSSVYGNNKKIPYSTQDKVDSPVSLYAASKKSNELMAYAYCMLYDIPTTGLRFFTVYGPMGRPDMAYFSFANKLCNKEKIQIFNYGNCKRDFTYIDDIVLGISKIIRKTPERDVDGVQYKIYNIGNNNPENLLDFVNILCEELIEAKVLPSDFNIELYKELAPMQPGDVEVTYADVDDLTKDFGYKPNTSLREGLKKFARWYSEYYYN